jgi:pimeloyl-ACP methyl ester carboxylesterase
VSQLRKVAVNGASLAMESDGRGPPLVLLHGFAADRRTWDQIVGALADEHLAVRYDLRGFGESLETTDLTFRHSEDLREIIAQLPQERCDLMGVSMGASIALSFSLQFPERVRRLILLSPGLVGWEWSEEWRARWSAITHAARSDRMAKARELWWQHPLFDTARGIPAARQRLREDLDRYSGRQWLKDNEAPALPDLDRLPLLTVPTLLLSGTRDIAEFRLIADLIEAAAPTVIRRDIDGGHLLYLEQPTQIIDQTRRFLTE